MNDVLKKQKLTSMLFFLFIFLVYKPSPTKLLGASLGLKFGDFLLFIIILVILLYDYKIVVPKTRNFMILVIILLVDMLSIMKSVFSGTLIFADVFELFRPLMYLMLYISVYKIANANIFNKKAMKKLFIGYLVFIGFSLIQLINLFNVKSYMSYFYEISKSRTMDTSATIWRLASTFTNPNYFGVFLVIITCFLFALLLTSKGKLKYGIPTIITIILIMFTGSRTSIISLVLSLLSIFLVLLIDLAKKRKNRKVFSILFVAAIALAFTILKLAPFVYAQFVRFSDYENIYYNFYTRYLAWESALEMWKTNPLLGNGPYKAYMDSFDNNYVVVLFRSGLIGFIAFVSLFLNNYRVSFKLIRLTPNEKIRTYCLSIVGVITTILVSMMASVSYNFIQVGAIFIFLIAIQDKLYSLEKGSS